VEEFHRNFGSSVKPLLILYSYLLDLCSDVVFEKMLVFVNIM